MMWDMKEEHALIYDKPVCDVIDKMCDVFDVVLEPINKFLWPSMICVDVFRSGKTGDFSSGEAVHGTLYELLQEFMLSEKVTAAGDVIVNEIKVKLEEVVDCLKNHMQTEFVMGRVLSKDDLRMLEKTYMGMLFDGMFVKCRDYDLIVLIGSSE